MQDSSETTSSSFAENYPDKKRSRVIIFVFVAVLVLLVSGFGYEVYLPHSPANMLQIIRIEPGMGSREIADVLTREGVIRSRWIFVTYISLKGVASSLKPGVYEFTDNSISEISKIIVAGGQGEQTLTIPEGWTMHDIAAYLEKNKIMLAEDFIGSAGDEGRRILAGRFAFLGDLPPGAGLEGYLFPDTYRAYRYYTYADDVIEKMVENFDRKVDADLRAAAAARQKSLFEIVNMASLLEKEVVSDEDRAIVSGILWKRLDAGIPLQVDATISYIKSQKLDTNGRVNGRISIADTKIDSPYNTYRYRGFPVGPIGNPGLAAIRAAVYPKASPYLYYLSARDGRTIFSRTLEEHNLAKSQHLGP